MVFSPSSFSFAKVHESAVCSFLVCSCPYMDVDIKSTTHMMHPAHHVMQYLIGALRAT